MRDLNKRFPPIVVRDNNGETPNLGLYAQKNKKARKKIKSFTATGKRYRGGTPPKKTLPFLPMPL
jgi:hypothetical protein